MTGPAMFDFTKFSEAGLPNVDEYLKSLEEDEEDQQWEYEYSDTDMEVYYLTVELSYPEFKEPAIRMPQRSRGGHKHRAAQTPAEAIYHKTNADESDEGEGRKDGEDEDEGDGEVEGGDDNDDDDDVKDDDDVEAEASFSLSGEDPSEGDADEDATPLDPRLTALDATPRERGKGADKGKGKGKGKGKEIAHEDAEHRKRFKKEEMNDFIQVLDLHTEHPLFSYRGRIFEGQWAEVIGTELITTKHEKKHALPALRNLREDVDVLGAVSSRILTKEKVVKARVPEEDKLAAIREEWNIRIPPGKNKTGERAQQTSFLENLIALKIKKGQSDQVTVYAKDGEGKHWDDRQGPDYKPRSRRTRATAAARGGSRSKGRPGDPTGRGRPRAGRRRRGGRQRSMSPISALAMPMPPGEGREGVAQRDEEMHDVDVEDGEDGEDDERGSEGDAVDGEGDDLAMMD